MIFFKNKVDNDLDFTFEGLKNSFLEMDKYYIETDKTGDIKLIDKETGLDEEDKLKKSRYLFILTWLKATALKKSSDEKYNTTFGEYAEEVYKAIMDSMEFQMNRFGEVFPEVVKYKVGGLDYKYGKDIVDNLFETPNTKKATIDWIQSKMQLSPKKVKMKIFTK